MANNELSDLERKVYAAHDNNGNLVCLTTSKRYSRISADSHYKDESQFIILIEDYELDTAVCNGKGIKIGTLADFAK